MPLSTQIKLLRAFREIILGDNQRAFPSQSAAKPSFTPGMPQAMLPRATPEAQGLPSQLLEQFYRDISRSHQTNAHSLLVARNGYVVCEGSFAPFRQDVWHVSHSLCKSIVGLAAGIAIDEGLFGLDDKVYTYFKQETSLLTPRSTREITVRHLLTMTSGITFNELSEAVETAWLKGIFASPTAFPAGARFVYNSMNSYLLAALICRTSGQSLMEYLTPRLFGPMGFGAVAWEKSPEGIEKGGWGMYLTIEDMVKIGQLFLNRGAWDVDGENRQLVPKAWIEQATALHATNEAKEGYGFHLWLDTATGNYILNGLFGQYIVVMPTSNVVIAMTGGSAKLFTESPAYTLMVRHFGSVPSSKDALPASPTAHASLARMLSSISFRQAVKTAASPLVRTRAKGRVQRWQNARQLCSGKDLSAVRSMLEIVWHFPPNRAGLLPIVTQIMDNNFSKGISSLMLRQTAEGLALHCQEGNQHHTIPIGLNRYIEHTLLLGREQFLAAATAQVCHNEDNDPVLVIELCYLEHSSSRTIKLLCKEGRLHLYMDEQPQLMVGLQAAIDQSEKTVEEKEKGRAGVADRIKKNQLFEYRLSQLCTPSLIGVNKEDGA